MKSNCPECPTGVIIRYACFCAGNAENVNQPVFYVEPVYPSWLSAEPTGGGGNFLGLKRRLGVKSAE